MVSTCLQNKSFKNTVGKGEIAQNGQFLLFPQCFLPIWRTLCHFHQIWNCRVQTLSIWNILKFVVREKIKSVFQDLESFEFDLKLTYLLRKTDMKRFQNLAGKSVNRARLCSLILDVTPSAFKHALHPGSVFSNYPQEKSLSFFHQSFSKFESNRTSD